MNEEIWGDVKVLTKEEIESNWIDAYDSFCNRGKSKVARPAIITPFNGQYGCAGFVITIDGSPEVGTMHVKLGEGATSRFFNFRIMYVLDREFRPQIVDKLRLHLENSKHKKLWMATEILLSEYIIRVGIQ